MGVHSIYLFSEEKRKSLGSKQSDSLRPSLANRLGPSPSDRRSRYGYIPPLHHTTPTKLLTCCRFPAARANQSKGSAIEIARAFKKKKMEEGKREEDKQKVKAMAKMINSHSKGPALRSSPLSVRNYCFVGDAQSSLLDTFYLQ